MTTYIGKDNSNRPILHCRSGDYSEADMKGGPYTNSLFHTKMPYLVGTEQHVWTQSGATLNYLNGEILLKMQLPSSLTTKLNNRYRCFITFKMVNPYSSAGNAMTAGTYFGSEYTLGDNVTQFIDTRPSNGVLKSGTPGESPYFYYASSGTSTSNIFTQVSANTSSGANFNISTSAGKPYLTPFTKCVWFKVGYYTGSGASRVDYKASSYEVAITVTNLYDEEIIKTDPNDPADPGYKSYESKLEPFAPATTTEIYIDNNDFLVAGSDVFKNKTFIRYLGTYSINSTLSLPTDRHYVFGLPVFDRFLKSDSTNQGPMGTYPLHWYNDENGEIHPNRVQTYKMDAAFHKSASNVHAEMVRSGGGFVIKNYEQGGYRTYVQDRTSIPVFELMSVGSNVTSVEFTDEKLTINGNVEVYSPTKRNEFSPTSLDLTTASRTGIPWDDPTWSGANNYRAVGPVGGLWRHVTGNFFGGDTSKDVWTGWMFPSQPVKWTELVPDQMLGLGPQSTASGGTGDDDPFRGMSLTLYALRKGDYTNVVAAQDVWTEGAYEWMISWVSQIGRNSSGTGISAWNSKMIVKELTDPVNIFVDNVYMTGATSVYNLNRSDD